LPSTVGDRGVLDRYAGDIELDRLTRLFVLRRRLGGGLFARAFDQVLKIEAAVLVLDDLRLEAAQAHPVHDHLAPDKREQGDRDLCAIERQELLVCGTLRKGYAGDLGAQAGIERKLQRSFKLEGAAGALFHDALDVVLVAIGIERHGEDDRRSHHEEDQSECHI
jgi:hypothetical protein